SSRPRHYTLFSTLFRPPPRPTLFPYTTLFRSAPADERVPPAEHEAVRLRHRLRGGRVGRHARRLPQRADRPPGHELRRHEHQPGDRKSTRLNSSHVSISYAVFCLKKKKTSKVA